MSVQSKFGVSGHEQRQLLRGVVQEYVSGLCWVMRYYYDGAHSHLLPASSASWIPTVELQKEWEQFPVWGVFPLHRIRMVTR